MPAPARLRTATPADLPELRRVFRAASLWNDGDREALLANPQLLDFTGDRLDDGGTRAAVLGGRLVGFATVLPRHDGEAELEDLFVEPAVMRRGIARLLVQDAVGIARAAGQRRIAVTGNPHALDFYLAVGFVQVGQADTELYPAPRLHLVLAAAGAGLAPRAGHPPS